MSLQPEVLPVVCPCQGEGEEPGTEGGGVTGRYAWRVRNFERAGEPRPGTVAVMVRACGAPQGSLGSEAGGVAV